jgi:hypothetical protein
LNADPVTTGVNLHFEGSNDGVWLWINGKFVGKHLHKPLTPPFPFDADVTDYLKWNTENQITIRVLTRGASPKIWMPVYLEVLKK